MIAAIRSLSLVAGEILPSDHPMTALVNEIGPEILENRERKARIHP
jgi:hypothetical protein